jgi:hypothetical protein
VTFGGKIFAKLTASLLWGILRQIWVKFNIKFEFWKLKLNCFIKWNFLSLLVLSWDLKNSSVREIMQLGDLFFFLKKKNLFMIIKESLIVKSLIKNFKFYLKDENLSLLGWFGHPIFTFAKILYNYKIHM